MTRPSFNTVIRGSVTTQVNSDAPTTTPVVDAMSCNESVTGVSRRKPAGWIAPTPYVFQRLQYVRHDGNVHQMERRPLYPSYKFDIRHNGVIGGGSTGLNSSYIFDEMYVPQGVPNSWRERCLTKARIKMKSGDINLGVAFAERNRTAKLVGDTAGQLVRSLRALRHGNFRDAARALGVSKPGRPRGSSVTSRWLELQYGWKPLLSDVYGSVDALARRRGEDWIVTAKSAYREPIERAYISPDFGIKVGVGNATGFRGCFVRIDAIPENDLLLSLSSLGLTNPALLAWELLPFSFVADWFIPVGSFLESLDAMLGYGPSWSSISSLEKVSWRHKLQGSSKAFPGGYVTTYVSKGQASKQYIRLERSGGSGVPIPNPYIKDPASLGHMANALSLLSQVFGGRRQ